MTKQSRSLPKNFQSSKGITIIFTFRDMFELNAQALVNPVNCYGVMGKGLALEFKNKFPEMFKDYKQKCDQKKIKPGKVHRYQDQFSIIYNFPTKTNWKLDSRLSYIEDGMKDLVKKLNKDKPETVAIPPLGCGLGGLDWDYVKEIIVAELKTLDYPAQVFICNPF